MPSLENRAPPDKKTSRMLVFPDVRFTRGCTTIKKNGFRIPTTGSQKPSVLRSMSKANCLIIIPETVEIARAGDKAAIRLIDHDEI
jgi:molybdopterin biosynthesis enzyme